MPVFPRSFLLFCTSVLAIRAAEPPSVILDPMVVTATPLPREQARLTSATGVLTDRELDLHRQPTLGETLSAQPGVSSTYFGPGASRPILRGFDGDRVHILQNGTGSMDASATSPDHAVGVEPFLVKRIEVVRGPASLRHGNSAVGGVVNVIDRRIPTEMPDRPVSAFVDARYGGASEEFARGGSTDVSLFTNDSRAVVAHIDGFKRDARDTRTPAGRLVNSAIESRGGSIGLSYVGETFDFGFNFNGYDSLYGVVAEPDVEIDLRQRRLDVAAEVKRDFGVFTGARFNLGLADYKHVELDAGARGTTFRNQGHDARLELFHSPFAGISGAWGVQAVRADVDIAGAEAFMPPAVAENHAVFLFEEKQTGAFTWQAGARVEHQSVKTRASGGFPVARSHDETTPSLSAGVVYSFSDYAVSLSVTAVERAPNARELYSDGPHVGTAAYEIGDPSLDTEKSFGAELGLRKIAGFVTGSLSLFANRFDGFIFEENTGAFDPIDGLPIYGFAQRDVLFYGAELETAWHLHRGERHAFDLKFNVDYTHARQRNGDHLPRIPPLKALVGLAWSSGPWTAGVDWQIVARQSDVAPSESETDGYALLGAHLGYRFAQGPLVYELFVRGTNLTDAEARVHTSFLKTIAPLPGRGVSIGLRASF